MDVFPPETVVETGHILLADIDGVVVIPPSILGQVLDFAEKIKLRDQETKRLIIQDGLSVREAFERTRPGYRVDA